MRTLTRIAVLMVCFIGGNAFAAGGACPSGVLSGVTNCYFVAANGSDSNSGTSESSPWAHAPGMPNCAANCAAVTPAPGDGFIFRGNDTWHFGNSSASPYTGGTWNWAGGGWSGTTNNPIYIGVDPSWFSGGSWARPILNADNPTSTSPVTSCAYQVGSSNDLTSWGSTSFVVIDNFEMTGLCQNDTNAPYAHDIYVVQRDSSYNAYEHLYIHGWTALAFSCAVVSGNPTGHCFDMFAFLGSNNDGDLYYQDIVDGSDSNPAALGVMYGGGYDISECVFRYASQIITTKSRLMDDTLFEHWYEPGDGEAHGNLFEDSGSSASAVHAYYNNLIRDICTDGGACPNGIVGFWPQPGISTTNYYFNNVFSNVATGGNYFDIGQNGSNQGTLVIFNNTFEIPASASYPFLNCNSSSTHPFTAVNNHFIGETSSPYSSPCTGGTFATNLLQSHSQADSNSSPQYDQYTTSESYAFSPTASTNSTVGKGTNEQAFCQALSSAGLSAAATACASDTTYACVYSTSNHTVSCPNRKAISRPGGAWDIGAYQYSQSTSTAPNPPEGLTAIVH